MLQRIFSLITALVFVALSSPGQAQSVMITEFMADNLTSSIRDEDGERNDWLELQNMTGSPISLNGWYLTDDAGDLRKWRFPVTSPAVTLAAGARIVIWCSDKNRKANAARLHTNFKLTKDGEFLGLVRPDGLTIEHSYGPKFPPQFINGTYGIAVQYNTTVLVAETAEGRAHVPQSAADYSTAMAGWNSSVSFDDSTWQAGSAFGFDEAATPQFLSLVGTDVSDAMRGPAPDFLGINSSLCVRYTFNLPAGTTPAALRLKMKYDDGFACFLNGTRVGNGLAPSDLAWDSANLLSINRPDSSASTFENVTLQNALPALVTGTNVLAFQLLNCTKTDPNALLRPQLEMDVAAGMTTGYLTSATPGTVNSAVATAIGPQIDSVTKNPARPVGGVGSAPITVTAKVNPTLRPLAATNPVVLKWRRMYGTETTVPMTFSAATGLYSAAVPTTSLAPGEMIRWRIEAKDNGATPTYAYAPEYPFSATTPPANPPTPGPATEPYIDLDQYFGTVALDTITTSNLPVLHWFAATPSNADGSGESCSFLFQPLPQFPAGTPNYTPPGPQFYDNIPVYRHGQSSSGFPQKSHNLNFNKDNRFVWKDGQPSLRGINLLSTYADKTKIRNSVVWDVWAKSGHLASHFAQQVRVQLNGSFRGLYDFVEDGNEDYLQRSGLDPLGSLYKVYNSLENANVAVNNGGGSEKKNPDTTDFSDLQAFVTGISDSNAMPIRLRYAYDNVDLASVVNFLAVHTLVMNRDFGHKNYYVFRDTASTGEWSALPWDQDLSFGHTWTSTQGYFDDDIHSGGPLQLGGGNRLNQIVFNSPELNAMFVARVRSLADQFLVSAGETNGPLEQKINELLNKIDPNPNNPAGGTDDADLNARQWGFWVDGAGGQLAYTDARMVDHTVRAQAARILTSNPIPPYPGAVNYAGLADGSSSIPPFLPGRRAFMFAATPPRSGTMSMPPSMPPNTSLVIENVDFNPTAGTQDQEFFIIRNTNNYAVDISGWQLSGEVEMTFRGGTVIPGQGATTSQATNAAYVNQLVVAKKPLGFRQRTTSPKANEYRQVSGPYKGQLSARGGTIVLSKPINPIDPSAGYTQVATQTYTGAPSASQQFLRIGELNYAPAQPTTAESDAIPGVSASDFEFIEFINIGTSSLNLQNAKIDRGVEFTFPNTAISTMAPGARRLVVSNVTAFRLRYGTDYDALILGEYLGNLNNSGEEIQILDPAGEVVLEFDYDPTWYSSTNGNGRTLVAVSTSHTGYGTAAAWSPSISTGGSPGVEEPPASAPDITQQPVGAIVNPGANVSLTVAAAGYPAPTYQWLRNNDVLNGANGATLPLNEITEAQEGEYKVLVSNFMETKTSVTVTVSVNDPVVIGGQPLGATENPGTPINLSVQATGTAPLTYQWRKGGVNIDGANGPTLALAGQESDEGSYDVVVSNMVGPKTSGEAVISINDPVVFNSQPGDATVNPNSPVTLSVSVTGTGAIAYQWYKGNDPIAGAQSNTYDIGAATEGDEGTYKVSVSNVVGTMMSANATVLVNDPIQIVAAPRPVAVGMGGRATFRVQAVGTGPVSYQWRKGEQNIDGATGPTFTIPAAVEADFSANYDVVVSNMVNAVTATPVALILVNWAEEAGSYQGLLAGPTLADPATNPRPGRVTATVAKGGRITGKLEYMGSKYSFRVTLDSSLTAQNVIVKRGRGIPLILNLELQAANDLLVFTVRDDALNPVVEASGEAPRIPVRPRTSPPLKMGRYTVLLDVGTGAPVNLTASGYLTLNIAKSGAVSWVGKMPDGGAVRGSASLTGDDKVAFYSSMYSTAQPYAGSIGGPLAIQGTAISGDLAWRKPQQKRGVYWPTGLSALVSADGKLYVPPARGTQVIAPATYHLDLAGPIPNGAYGADLSLSLQNKFMVPLPNLEKVKLSVSLSTGAMTGSYFDSTLRKTRKLEGVLLQEDARAGGFFLGVDTAGSWELETPVAP